MQYNGLKFSFSLHAHTPPSSHSTPKFPSIEIQKEMHDTHRKQAVIYNQNCLITASPFTQDKKERVRPESKSKRILQKYAHLTVMTNKERQQKDSRSVKSAQSSKSQKNYGSKAQTEHSFTKSIKNRHNSLSTSSFSPLNNSFKRKSKTKTQTKDAYQEQIIIRRRLFKPKSVEKLSNLKLFLGSKPKDSPQKHQMLKRNNITDKGKSFKSISYKPRPILKIGSRILNNRKLQQMSRPYQMQDGGQF